MVSLSGPCPTPTSTIILLDGTCSAGKSTLATELQRLLGNAENVKIVRCDEVAIQVFHKLVRERGHSIPPEAPKDLLSHLYKSVPEIDGNFLNDEINREMYELIRQATVAKKFVINDNACTSQEDVDACNCELNGYNVIRVFVHSSLDDLLMRVRTRNQGDEVIEHRVMTLPFEVLSYMCRPKQTKDRAVVDTWDSCTVTEFMRSLQDQYEDTPNQYWNEQAASFFSSLDKFYKHFQLDIQNSVEITPIYPFDLLVNTSSSTTEFCARQIVDFVQQH